MAFWQVPVPPVTDAPFNRMVPAEVLFEFNGPATFTFMGDKGILFLAHLVDGDEEFQRYFVAAVRQSVIDMLKAGAVSIRAALDQAYTWLVDVRSDGRVKRSWRISVDRLPGDSLPQMNILLYPTLEPLVRQSATGAGKAVPAAPFEVTGQSKERAAMPSDKNPHGATLHQGIILAIVDAQGPLTSSGIADAYKETAKVEFAYNYQFIVTRRMADRGLIKAGTIKNSKGHRVLRWTITTKGRKMLSQARQLSETMLKIK